MGVEDLRPGWRPPRRDRQERVQRRLARQPWGRDPGVRARPVGRRAAAARARLTLVEEPSPADSRLRGQRWRRFALELRAAAARQPRSRGTDDIGGGEDTRVVYVSP